MFVDTTLVRRRELGSDLTDALRAGAPDRDFRLRDRRRLLAPVGGGEHPADRRRAGEEGREGLPRGRHAARGARPAEPDPVLHPDFEVVRGDVRYFGTPDLNAELDIEAQHVVRTLRNEELPVIALVTGTLFDPKLTLDQQRAAAALGDSTWCATWSPARRPARRRRRAAQRRWWRTRPVVRARAPASNELERTLVSDLGMPSTCCRSARWSAAAGQGQQPHHRRSRSPRAWQLGPQVFVTFNAGFCPSQLSSFDYRNFGAGIEWRVRRSGRSRAWWSRAAALRPDRRSAAVSAPRAYQVGADVLWQREF